MAKSLGTNQYNIPPRNLLVKFFWANLENHRISVIGPGVERIDNDLLETK